MIRTVYVNGEYLTEDDAVVSVFDRGFLFADGVYEVTSVLDGKLIDFDGHAARLERSLHALDMDVPLGRDTLLEIHRKLIQANGIKEGVVYLQVTRGEADRDFVFPRNTSPTLVLFTQAKSNLVDNPAAQTGIKVISAHDKRWALREIKTIQLLYPSMAKMMALNAGADDAWLLQDGYVTESTSANAYIVKEGVIITRELSSDILHGITRAAILRLARSSQLQVEERQFSLDEAKAADEAFITSASTFVMPVVEIDGVPIGDGSPGLIAPRLREIYIEECRRCAV